MNSHDHSPRRRNADKTRRLLIEAVGKILVKKGYRHVTAKEVSQMAGVDRKLINYYFGSLNSLLKTYIYERHFWMPVSSIPGTYDSREYIFGVLKEHLEYFLRSEEMQCFVQWQISEYHPVISSVARLREDETSRLLEICENRFAGSEVNLHAVLALLVGGIYATVLQGKAGNSPICGIDPRGKDGHRALIDSIGQILDWAWKASESG